MAFFNFLDDQDSSCKPANRWVSLIPLAMVLFAVVYNLYSLYPEVGIQAPDLNDRVLHLAALDRASAVLDIGTGFTDPWLDSIGMGYPLFHHYQHLPYLAPSLVQAMSLGSFQLFDLLIWTNYLLLALFPIAVYWSMRRFGFGRFPAASGSLVAPLISTDALFGLEFGSYIWRGQGLYTQLWGMVLLPPALALGYGVLRDGRGYLGATVLLGATLMSHLLLGYIAFLAMGVIVLVPAMGLWTRGVTLLELRRRVLRLAILSAVVFAVTSYFIVPFLLDGSYLNRSIWELAEKYDSYGANRVLGTLFKGDLFDFGRLPVFTILAAAGLAVCLRQWRQERFRVPVVILVLFLLIYFGRPTWGPLLNLLPMGQNLHLHRFIAGVHLGGILLVGMGLALPWQWALSRSSMRYLLVAAVITVALLLPMYMERSSYLEQNATWMGDTQRAFQSEQQDIDGLLEMIDTLPPGRVYAGLAGNWGSEYKVGSVPVYAVLSGRSVDSLGYLYHALSLNSDAQVLFDEARSEHYNLFNVRYVVAPADRVFPEFVQPLQDFGRHRMYEVASTGYFDLVGSELSFSGGKKEFYPAASTWLTGGLPGVKQHPSIDFSGESEGPDPAFRLSNAEYLIQQAETLDGPTPGHVSAEGIGSNTYVAEVRVERESMLMLKSTYHPNWHAFVDGVETETVMLMPSYVGVKLLRGNHIVRLQYQSRPLRATLLLAGLILIAPIERYREEIGLWVTSEIAARIARFKKGLTGK
ncbi:MAG: hypothetical protein CMJ45_02285 [Planctomyces sp.]|nr:hypothetical protein [Planctomyces sp.]